MLQLNAARIAENIARIFGLSLAGREKLLTTHTDPKSHVNICYLQTPEMEARIQKLHDSTCTLAKKVGCLEAKINAVAEKAGVMVDEGMHQDITAIMKSENAKVTSRVPSRFISTFVLGATTEGSL